MKFKIFRFKKVKSTNNTAIRIIKKTNVDYGMIVSANQSNGKGQRGRKWISYKGNLFVTFFYNLKNINFSLSKITKFNCLLVKRIISKYYKKRIFFKKPNDLLIEKKKICGILQETINKFDNKYLIVGIGVNLLKSPQIKGYPTTCLYDLINERISTKIFEKEIKDIFEKNLNLISKTKIR